MNLITLSLHDWIHDQFASRWGGNSFKGHYAHSALSFSSRFGAGATLAIPWKICLGLTGLSMSGQF